MDAAQQNLFDHVRSARFQAGAARGRWTLLSFEWPHLVMDISVRDGTTCALRFDCTGYPDSPPTAMPWDPTRQDKLDPARWPRGGRVSQVFNPNWKSGTALYLPCDRQSIAGHDNWNSEHSWLIWNPARGLVQYLEAVHEVLQSHELVPHAA